MTSFRHLATFLAIAKYGNFAAAAEKIGLTAAAIGQQMRQLEADLGQALFYRDKREVRLTPEALRILPQAYDVVAKMEALTSGNELSGSLRIGAVVSALMGAFAFALHDLKRDYPQLEIKLMAGLSNHLVTSVANGELDVAVVTQAPYTLPPSLQWTWLYNEPMVLIVPKRANFALISDHDPLAILRQSPFLRFDRQTWSGYLVDEVLRQCGVDVQTAMELNSAEALFEIVRQGFGVAIVPLLANMRWQEDPHLRVINLPGVNIDRRIGLLERTHHGRETATNLIKSYFTERHQLEKPSPSY